MKKRLLAMFMAFVMAMSLLPMSALATKVPDKHKDKDYDVDIFFDSNAGVNEGNKVTVIVYGANGESKEFKNVNIKGDEECPEQNADAHTNHTLEAEVDDDDVTFVPSYATVIFGDNSWTVTLKPESDKADEDDYYGCIFATYTVTYEVKNGRWDDNTTGAKTETVTSENGTLNHVPQVGNEPNPGYKAGSWSVDDSSKGTITNGAPGSATGDVTFTYTYAPRTDLSYTVKYLEKDTDKVLAPEKTVNDQTLGAKAEESAIDIAGYNKVAPTTREITIAASGNAIIFYYTARTDLSYTVKYLEKDTGKVLADEKIVNNQTLGTKATESAIDIAGYNKVAPTTQEITIAASGNAIIFYYTARTDLSYTVKYLEKDTEKVLAPEKIVNDQTFGTVITSADEKIAIPGYAFDCADKESLTIGLENNVITLYYAVDNWKDADKTDEPGDTDSTTGGDGIPDKYQAVVLFKSKDEAKGTVTGDGIVQVFTFSEQKDGETVYLEKGTVDPDMTNVTATAKSGYKFSIWTKDNGTTSVNPDTAINDVAGGTIIQFYANWAKKSSHKPPVLNKEDHYAYVVGYPDGTVQPQGNITRAEVATIFFRMLTDDSRNEFWSQTNSYSDVSEGQWFNNAISTLANAGILSGYPDGTFRPNAPITRAEFTKIAASFFEQVEYTIDNPFIDVDDDDWFYKFVMAAYEDGLITGYPGGAFRPNANINRAEAMTIVNRTLGRAPDADHFLKDMIVWPDNAKSAWYYEAVQEATNSHEYVMKGTGTNQYEEWTKILKVRDWPALEKEWSDANSSTGGEVVK